MSRLKPWWHEDQAGHYEREANWFAAGFHWSWVAVFAPAAAEKWERLDQACRHLKSWQLAQTACDRLAADQAKYRGAFPAQSPWLNFLLAMAYHRQGQKLKARECFERAALPKEAGAEQRTIFEQLRREAEREMGRQKY